MNYLLIHCVEETSVQSSDEDGPVEPALASWLEEMGSRGLLRHGDRLRPAGDATTVRSREGETVVADGPFAETKEQIVGYDVIECADLDEAIEVASKHPVASIGTVEVRPFWPLNR